MCLIVFAHQHHPDYPLVFAANRDESYERPTAPAEFWEDAPHVLAGRDKKAGGTWMGVTRKGHWGAITNVRDEVDRRPDAPSRGHLVADYLREEPQPDSYLEQVADRADQYNGFNLLVGTPEDVHYFSNRENDIHVVSPGIHGISNARLNTSWPKVKRGKEGLASILDGDITADRLLELLDDRQTAPDEQLPDTGVGQELERQLSPIFINGSEYGTRASTVLLLDRSGQVTFVERNFQRGTPTKTRRFSFECASAPTA